MPTTTQMNFRIDSELKKAGDLVLGQSGVTPSNLVRTTWEYLQRNMHVPDAVSQLVSFLENDATYPAGPAAEVSEQLEAEQIVMAGPNLIRDFYERVGVNPSAIEPRSFDDMKLDAYSQKYPELGEAQERIRPQNGGVA